MPTRKQRRRREKELRHEYEIVWEDAEGNELDPDDSPSNGREKRTSRPVPRSRRAPQPPSWRRTLKRTLIFAPVMFATVLLLSRNLTPVQVVAQTALIVAIFIPFSHLLDGFFWRGHQRRAAKREHARGKRGS